MLMVLPWCNTSLNSNNSRKLQVQVQSHTRPRAVRYISIITVARRTILRRAIVTLRGCRKRRVFTVTFRFASCRRLLSAVIGNALLGLGRGRFRSINLRSRGPSWVLSPAWQRLSLIDDRFGHARYFRPWVIRHQTFLFASIVFQQKKQLRDR